MTGFRHGFYRVTLPSLIVFATNHRPSGQDYSPSDSNIVKTGDFARGLPEKKRAAETGRPWKRLSEVTDSAYFSAIADWILSALEIKCISSIISSFSQSRLTSLTTARTSSNDEPLAQ